MTRLVLRQNVPCRVGSGDEQVVLVLVKVRDDDPPTAVVRVLRDGAAADNEVRLADDLLVAGRRWTVQGVEQTPRARVDLEVAS